MTDSESKYNYNFDQLKMYFGEPYTIISNNSKIIINQPTIGDILETGENVFCNMLYTFIGNTTIRRLQLWDNGIDWNKISDYELFCTLIKGIDNSISKIIFGDIDFSSFNAYTEQINNKETIILFSKKHNLEMSEQVYFEMREYLRLMFNIYPKTEKAKGKSTKQWMIDEEREKLKNESNSFQKSSLLSLVSFCINHPGFKYRMNELKDINIVQFMDSVQRLQIYESTSALNSGLYSGMCDLSKVDKNLFNFMRDIDYK